MATILPFVIRRGTAPRSRASTGAASIIIFPGVRYEKQSAPGGDAPSSADGASRKRKSKGR